MKKIIKTALLLLFTSNIFAIPSNLNIINATANYTLYYQVKLASKANCYPIITASKVTGSYNYLSLGSGLSLTFNNFNQLSTLNGGGLNFTRQTSTNTSNISLTTAQNYCTPLFNSFNMEWAGFIYKVENGSNVEGAWMRFTDFASCLSSGYNDYVSLDSTEAYTTYTIGGERYFVVSDI